MITFLIKRTMIVFGIAAASCAAAVAPAAFGQANPQIIAESWDAIFAKDSKVGHIHVWIEPVKDGQGRELRRVRVHYEMTFGRGADKAHTELEYGTIETPDGEVLRLDTLTRASKKQDIRTFGDVKDGKMLLTLEVGRRQSQQEIAWDSDVLGPYGPELSLSRKMMEPGETRVLKTFIPDLNKVCLSTLKAVDWEQVPLGPESAPFELLRVEQSVTDLGGASVHLPNSTLWVDKSGQIMKTFTDAFGGLFTYRTTKQGATSSGRAPFQLLGASIIRTPPISNPETARVISYRMKGSDVEKLFPNDQRQTVTAEGPGVIRVDVSVDSPQTGAAGPTTVDGAYSRANPLIDSQDEVVLRHAQTATRGKTDAWEKAVSIQDWVYRSVTKKDFATTFAPAAEVARDLTGDCTEHAVLTAAMCRAVGVPARCAVGLVYAPPEPRKNFPGGFGYHMWNEVHVNGRWVAIDAAYNQSRVDPTHIKMLDSSLDGVSPFETFLPVIQVFDKLTIEPLEIRR